MMLGRFVLHCLRLPRSDSRSSEDCACSADVSLLVLGSSDLGAAPHRARRELRESDDDSSGSQQGAYSVEAGGAYR
eukprot:4516394-Pleurochrysis_carterae.AAC.2